MLDVDEDFVGNDCSVAQAIAAIAIRSMLERRRVGVSRILLHRMVATTRAARNGDRLGSRGARRTDRPHAPERAQEQAQDHQGRESRAKHAANLTSRCPLRQYEFGAIGCNGRRFSSISPNSIAEPAKNAGATAPTGRADAIEIVSRPDNLLVIPRIAR